MNTPNTKNVLMTTLSTLNNRNILNYYYYFDKASEQRLVCNGISSLEAGSKFFLSTEKIDRIVVVGSKETVSGTSVPVNPIDLLRLPLLEAEELSTTSAYEFYIQRIAAFLQNNTTYDDYVAQSTSNGSFIDASSIIVPHVANLCTENCPDRTLPVIFVSETTPDNTDNLAGIVSALCEPGENVNLFIDMQGGNRTSGYVRNAVLSILTNQITSPVSIAKIVATNFTPGAMYNEIVDETARYKITDLAAGMNAFIRYGKADIIESYCNAVNVPEESAFRKLVGYMVDIDHAISLCNINALQKAIDKLRDFFSSEPSNASDPFSNYYAVLSNGIKQDYGVLLDGLPGEKIRSIDLIEWCSKKGFVQQALTLIEDKMPGVYFDQKWLVPSFPNDEQEKLLLELGPSHEKRRGNLIYYYLSADSRPVPTPDNAKTLYKLWWYFKEKGISSAPTFLQPDMLKQDLKKRLQTEGFSYTYDVNVTKLLSDVIKDLENAMQANQMHAIPYLYCKFRTLAQYRINAKSQDERTPDRVLKYAPDTFFYLMEKDYNQNYEYKDPSVSFTVLSFLGTRRYRKNMTKGKANQQPIEFELGLDTHPLLNPNTNLKNFKELEFLFMLHDALKKERNFNNHADERDVRLPKPVLEAAIKQYVAQFRRIQSLLQP